MRFGLSGKFLISSALAVAVALPLSVAPLHSPAMAASPSANLDAAVKSLRAVKSMTANFSQTDRNGQTVSGKLYLKQPGKIRFQYSRDVNLLIVADGNSLAMIDYDVRQVQRWPIKNSPLGALLDPSRDLKKYGKIVDNGDPNVISVEIRDSAHPEYGVMTLVFVRRPSAPMGLELAGWVALDSQNNRTTIRLSNQRYGASIANSTFRWKDPRRTTRNPNR